MSDLIQADQKTIWELRAEVERLERGRTFWEKAWRKERDENARLAAALGRYGLHTWDCAWNDSKGEKPCDCGWAALEPKP
jgi:hypothetical protein